MTINNSLLDIYAMMTPKALVMNSGGVVDASNAQDIEELILGLLCNPQGEVAAYSKVKKGIEQHYEGVRDPKKQGELKKSFHVISLNEDKISFGDEDYWKLEKPEKGKKTTTKTVDDLNGIITLDGPLKNKKLSAFVTSCPRITPAVSGTDAVQLFLNYMPSIMPSRMIPYLKVEFEMHHPAGLLQANSKSINTPNMIRFLLGSSDGGADTTQKNIPITEADKAMLQMSPGQGDNQRDTLYMGPEMFFMPQTLTNMDYLGGGGVYKRLVKPKPFLPFASIEDMLIQYMNAGAGALIHKKGTLKLKIHDKSRLSELAPFIKGANGFSDVTVWTTSGWLAPRTTDESEDHYSKFINQNMIKTDCWMISNTQFSFGGGDQASLTLEMVSKGIREAHQATIDGGQAETQRKALQQLAVAVQGLTANLPEGSVELQADLKTTQLIDASRRGVMLDLPASDFSGYDNLITKTVDSLKKGGKISTEDATALENNIKDIKEKTKAFTKQIQSDFMSKLQEGTGVLEDPFLADSVRSAKGYFNEDLTSAIDKFTDAKVGGSVLSANIYQSAINDAAARGLIVGKTDFNVPRIISFGKLFMKFVAPAMLQHCDELQVIFYGLNEECGPVSGHSIAEFPIDTHRLMNGYLNLVKNSNGPLTIEAFMGLVIENQFADNRSPGYGMYNAYEPYKISDKGEMKKKETKQYESVMTDWCAKYGSLKRPIIEMVVESSSKNSSSGNVYDKIKKSRKTIAEEESKTEGLIKRVHIYDKQHSPYNLLTKLMKTDTGWEIGEINSEPIEKFLKEKYPSTPNKKGKTAAVDAASQMVTEVNKEVEGALKVVENPYGRKYVISKGPSSAAEIRKFVKSQAPNIVVGTNGTLVKNITLSSKTDGLIAAANIINAQKGATAGGGGEGAGLEDPNGLPLRVVPAQLSMTTLGCPIAQMYQQYFVDLGTGTTLDNLYTTTQISHTIAPGRFETSWTLAYTDGYGKFQSAPEITAVVKGEVAQRLAEIAAASKKSQGPKPQAAAPAGGGG